MHGKPQKHLFIGFLILKVNIQNTHNYILQTPNRSSVKVLDKQNNKKEKQNTWINKETVKVKKKDFTYL